MDKVGLEHIDPPAPASQVWGVKAYTTIPNLIFFLSYSNCPQTPILPSMNDLSEKSACLAKVKVLTLGMSAFNNNKTNKTPKDFPANIVLDILFCGIEMTQTQRHTRTEPEFSSMVLLIICSVSL